MRKCMFLLLAVLLGFSLLLETAYAQWTEQNSGTAVNLISVSAPTYQNAWVAGPAGTVKRTVDNGTTWTDKSISGIGDLWNVYALDENTAFVLGFDLEWNSHIWRTGDGGTTWTVVLTLPPNYFLNAIAFFDSKEGIAVGDPDYNYLPGPNHWTVFKTFDGGLTWGPIKHMPYEVGMNFGWKNSIEIIGNTVYFGTASFDENWNFQPDPYIYKSVNRGETWTAKAAPGVVQVNTLHFVNKQTGYGCRGKSTDNGNTWVTMPDPFATVPNDINNFILSATGLGSEVWVTGIHRESPAYPGVWWNYPDIYYSNNGGLTWALDYTVTGCGLNEVRISRDNRALFALKDNGGILMKLLPAPSSYQIAGKDKKYELRDNYPNPFNPVTTISYAVPQKEIVSIKIYDMAGRVVADLVNETKTAGDYRVTWNAAGLSSGIYFYKMQAGRFTEVKKMILVK